MTATLKPTQKKLRIHEIYTSIQGETSYAGLPTLFIRLAGCPLRCTWCDTTYAFGRGEGMEIEALLEQVKQSATTHICLTGGEPLAQPAAFELIRQLCDQNLTVTIETGGSISIEQVDPRAIAILDIKCPASGEQDKMHWANLTTLRERDEVKFVIGSRDDYDYAKRVCQEYQLFKRLTPPLFSPVWDVMDLQQLSEWILEDQLPCRLNLQLHKVIWGSNAQHV